MACRAVLGRVHFPVVNKLFSVSELLFFGSGPVEVVYIFWSTDFFLGSAMALETESHAEGFGMVDFFHFVNFPMAVNATDAAVDVHSMVKVDVVGGFMNLHPRDRGSLIVGFPDEFQLGILGENLVVAIHTGRGGWDIGEPGCLHTIMAIAAIQTQLIGVDGMGE